VLAAAEISIRIGSPLCNFTIERSHAFPQWRGRGSVIDADLNMQHGEAFRRRITRASV
jgi:hypothetical protein